MADTGKATPGNYFNRNRVYPDAKTLLSWMPKDIDAIKDAAIVVPDTNVLLLPYGTSTKNLGEIADALRSLKSKQRLFVPGQVIREFADNRSVKLAELVQQLVDKHHGQPKPSRYPLLSGLPDFEHFNEAEEQLCDSVKKHNAALDALIDVIKGWYWNDPVSKLYRDIFDDKVVVEPSFNEDEVIKEHETRVAQKLPPGYKDAAKDDGGIGDYLIWKTILEIGKGHKKDVVFVSSETKADWWHRTKSGPLYPRFELIDEFRRATGGRSFHITMFHKLLEILGVDPTIVTQVKEQEEVARAVPRPEPQISQPSSATSSAVRNWLLRCFPTSSSRLGIGNEFRIVTKRGWPVTLVVVEYYEPAPKFLADMRSTVDSLPHDEISKLVYVVVCRTAAAIDELQDHGFIASPFVHPNMVAGIIIDGLFRALVTSAAPSILDDLEEMR